MVDYRYALNSVFLRLTRLSIIHCCNIYDVLYNGAFWSTVLAVL